jgi:valyl-tRNA synthetase
MTDTTETTATTDRTATAERSERARIERYQPTEIEPRWQRRWEELGLYRTDLGDTSRPKF